MDLSGIVNSFKVLNEVAIQDDQFDLFQFFDEGKDIGYMEGACGYITRRQTFYCYSHRYHALVFENVSGSLYDDLEFKKNAYYEVFNEYYPHHTTSDKNNNDAWRYANADFGAISIQMLSRHSVFIWMPNVINSYQKKELLKFFSEIDRINSYFEENGYSNFKIDISIAIREKDEFSKIADVSYLREHVDELVDDNCFCPYENIISDYKIGHKQYS